MKLFIWSHHYWLAFAVAENETEARKLVEKEVGYKIWAWGELEVRPLSKPVARYLYNDQGDNR